MLAFLVIVLLPALALFTLAPAVLFGLMLESVQVEKTRPRRAERNAFATGHHSGFVLSDACVPSSA